MNPLTPGASSQRALLSETGSFGGTAAMTQPDVATGVQGTMRAGRKAIEKSARDVANSTARCQTLLLSGRLVGRRATCFAREVTSRGENVPGDQMLPEFEWLAPGASQSSSTLPFLSRYQLSRPLIGQMSMSSSPRTTW